MSGMKPSQEYPRSFLNIGEELYPYYLAGKRFFLYILVFRRSPDRYETKALVFLWMKLHPNTRKHNRKQYI